MGEQTPTPAELLAAIRKTVEEWAAIYKSARGHAVDPVYVGSLANDIAFELGILEALSKESGQ